jgi:hypothetical protein
MSDRQQEQVLCSCSSTAAVLVHTFGTYCGDEQLTQLADLIQERNEFDRATAESVAATALQFMESR